MAGRTAVFLAAKQALRAHPGWTDEQVAGHIGVTTRDTPGMETIAAARKDLAASEHGGPDLHP
jgi:hypothetical protein